MKIIKVKLGEHIPVQVGEEFTVIDDETGKVISVGRCYERMAIEPADQTIERIKKFVNDMHR